MCFVDGYFAAMIVVRSMDTVTTSINRVTENCSPGVLQFKLSDAPKTKRGLVNTTPKGIPYKKQRNSAL